MYKTILVNAVQKPPVEISGVDSDKDVKLIIARDDEIYDPGNESLTFSTNDNEQPFYVLSKDALFAFSSIEWINSGITFAKSANSNKFFIKGSDFLDALIELGYDEFEVLKSLL